MKTKKTAQLAKEVKKQIRTDLQPEHLTRETVKGLSEVQKDALRAEAFSLLAKGRAATGSEKIELSPEDHKRFSELIRCGMLPSDPPLQEVGAERKPYLLDVSRERFEASRKRLDWPARFFNNPAEVMFVKSEFMRLVANANGEVAEELRPDAEKHQKRKENNKKIASIGGMKTAHYTDEEVTAAFREFRERHPDKTAWDAGQSLIRKGQPLDKWKHKNSPVNRIKRIAKNTDGISAEDWYNNL